MDVIGPYDLLKFIPHAETRFVAVNRGQIPNDRCELWLSATHTFDETQHADIVVVPGSEANTAIAAADKHLINWLRRIHNVTRFTTSVCSGAIILGAAGLLRGQPATTHWAAMSALKHFGAWARPDERIVRAGKVWTAAGASAGLDLALSLIEEIESRRVAECAQLLLEYDPRPAINAGHMSKAPDDVKEVARKQMAELSRHPVCSPDVLQN